MSLKCGIVGLPNVGKSTLYNALTKADIPAENYPFCTIEPNSGIVSLPDKRLDKLKSIYKPLKTIPSIVEFTDIAGLVKGASKGEGLGNKFLGHIRETNAIIHIVRCFENERITHVNNKIDPIQDVKVIETELLLSDLDSLTKQEVKAKKQAKGGNNDAKKVLDLINKLIAHCNSGNFANTFSNIKSENEIIDSFNLLTAKPMLYIANVDEDEILSNDYNLFSKKLQAYAKQKNSLYLKICASIEHEISNFEKEEEKQFFLNEYKLSEPGLDKIIKYGFDLLGLQTFFTCGEKEVRSWTIPKNALAPEAAGRIHSDFQRGFIKADVFHYNDIIKYQSEKRLSELGLIRQEGKEYVVQDGDCLFFKFNV